MSSLEALFHLALQQPLAERPAWVDEHLRGDAAQAQLLKRMLEHAQAEATGLGQAIGEFARETAAPRDRTEERIGRYRLIERLRYGGMAEVYRAARDDGEFEFEVALKVVRSDRIRPELNALFAAERALLARLKHPNIIQIFDGGTTADGEAWFVMDLLDGLPLPAAIVHHQLDGPSILTHLTDLCAAIGHAHAQLIVHRDIKPENVLLCRTAQGLSVKLIDFGIAAGMQSGLGEASGTPAAGAGWHSPGYAAPEALAGQGQGVAADVFALGRLLLDCVALCPPRWRDELRAIGEQASHADPARRYPAASSVAEDLARMRRGEPISLFRQRRLHVLRKALSRHRWAVAGALLVLSAGAIWLWREASLRILAQQATAVAEAERDRAAAMRDFLLRAFDASNPELNRGEEPRLSDLVVEQLALLQQATHLDPDSHLQLLMSFGDLLLQLDRLDLADQTFQQAIGLLESAGQQGDFRWIRMHTRRGRVASYQGRFDAAKGFFERAKAALDRWPASLDQAREASQLYAAWGASAQRRGDLEEAERLIRIGLEAKPVLKAAGDPAGDDAAMRVTLGAILSAKGDLTGALETFQLADADHRAAGFSQTIPHLALLGWLGITLDRLGRPAEAEPYLREGVTVAEKLFPNPHALLSGGYANLGRMLLNQGRLAEARPLIQRAFEVSEAAGAASTPDHASRLLSLGLLAFESEQFDAAITRFEQSLALTESTLGPSHRRSLSTRLALLTARAEFTIDSGLLAAINLLLVDVGPAPFRAEALLLKARIAASQGANADAQAALAEARTLMSAAKGPSPDAPKQQWMEARALLAMSQREDARAAFLAAAAAWAASGREAHPGRGRTLLHAALLHPDPSPERARLGSEARTILSQHLHPPAASLRTLESL
ncbi:MAG: protein kinase domain-containing protein [Pseudomarimonas sp.]